MRVGPFSDPIYCRLHPTECRRQRRAFVKQCPIYCSEYLYYLNYIYFYSVGRYSSGLFRLQPPCLVCSEVQPPIFQNLRCNHSTSLCRYSYISSLMFLPSPPFISLLIISHYIALLQSCLFTNFIITLEPVLFYSFLFITVLILLISN